MTRKVQHVLVCESFDYKVALAAWWSASGSAYL